MKLTGEISVTFFRIHRMNEMLSALVGQPKPLVVNTDLDGLLSALILTNYWGASVGGFCNSKNKIWIRKGLRMRDCIFVDMFVNMPTVACIDQHIIATDEEHAEKLGRSGRIANPNLDRKRTFKDNYALKFPFSASMYLLAMTNTPEKWFDPERTMGGNPSSDMLFRCDDILWIARTSPYVKNAEDWWEWLHSKTFNQKSIAWTKSLIDAVPKNNVDTIRARASNLLQSEYGCSRPDGGMDNVIGQNGMVTPEWSRLADELAIGMGMGIMLMEGEYGLWSGRAARYTATDDDLSSLKNEGTVRGKKVISYAFVKNVYSPMNLSVTHPIDAIANSPTGI